MIPTDQLPPGSQDLFHVLDHVLRAAQPDADGREWHIEWARYHWGRYQNVVGTYRDQAGFDHPSDEEREMWDTMEAMFEKVGKEP